MNTRLSAKSSLFDWMDLLITRKREAGKDATADLYRATRNWLWKYLSGRAVAVRNLTSALVDGFATYLQNQERLRTNTIHSYLSGFRAMYNRIVGETGYRPLTFPFRNIVIRLEKTIKRAVSVEILEKVAKLDLHGDPGLELAADLCMFSFLACGIPFVDLAHLTNRNIEGDTLVYHRSKTKALIRVAITHGMQHLIDKYALKDSPYLFPILPADGNTSYEGYKALLRKYNCDLKEIGQRLGTAIPLTSYVIRHTWATEAHRHYIPVAIISQALGHSSEKTTHYYLAQLDISELSKANAIVTHTVDRLILGQEYP